MSIVIDNRMIEPMDHLREIGFAIKQIYHDGSLLMKQSDGPVKVFIRPDGSVTPPMTDETQIVAALLYERSIITSVKSNN